MHQPQLLVVEACMTSLSPETALPPLQPSVKLGAATVDAGSGAIQQLTDLQSSPAVHPLPPAMPAPPPAV